MGRYSLDLLLSDAKERVAIVENQFGQTDHDHLGKLLTYCAGTEADVVIWIAEELNEEHVAALDWLNENTVDDITEQLVQAHGSQPIRRSTIPRRSSRIRPRRKAARERLEAAGAESGSDGTSTPSWNLIEIRGREDRRQA